MLKNKGLAKIFLLVIILVLVGGGVAVYLLQNKVSLPGITKSGAKPKVAVAKGNRNPFAKESQYVNPFDESKSPFVNFEVTK